MTTTTAEPAVANWRAHTPRQAADIMHVPVGQIYGAIQRGELEAVRIGKHIRISDSALRRFAGQDPLAESA